MYIDISMVVLISCAVVATVAFVAVAVQAIQTLSQVRHTARAMEYLALNADDKLAALDPALNIINGVSTGLNSGWVGVVKFFAGLMNKK